MTRVAKETCGEEEKRIVSPWMIGKEEELQRMKGSITSAVNRRNNISIREREEGLDLIEEMNIAREELKNARKEMRRES